MTDRCDMTTGEADAYRAGWADCAAAAAAALRKRELPGLAHAMENLRPPSEWDAYAAQRAAWRRLRHYPAPVADTQAYCPDFSGYAACSNAGATPTAAAGERASAAIVEDGG